MKKLMVVLAAMAFVIIMVGGAYADTAVGPNVTVNAAVAKSCVAGTAGVLDFVIDPSSAALTINAGLTKQATVFCSNKMPFTMTAQSTNKGGGEADCYNAGAGITGILWDGGTATPMNYTFVCNVANSNTNGSNGKGFGTGKDVSLGISASIAQSEYQLGDAGAAYQDIITMTITY